MNIDPRTVRQIEADTLRRMAALLVRMSHRGVNQAVTDAMRNNAEWIVDYAERVAAGTDFLPGMDGRRPVISDASGPLVSADRAATPQDDAEISDEAERPGGNSWARQGLESFVGTDETRESGP